MTTTRDMLARLPELAAEAFISWGHPNPGERSERGQKQVHAPAPTDLATLAALFPDRDGLLFKVAQCSRAVGEHLDAEGIPPKAEQPASASWTGECAYLLAHESVWTADPWLDEYVTEQITRVHDTLSQITRQPKPMELRCLKEGCSGRINPLVIDNDDGTRRLLADACENGHRVDRHEAIRRMIRLQDLPLTELAQHVGVPDKTLYRWAKRGLIHPIRHDRRGVALFNFEAVHRVAQATRAHGA